MSVSKFRVGEEVVVLDSSIKTNYGKIKDIQYVQFSGTWAYLVEVSNSSISYWFDERNLCSVSNKLKFNKDGKD